MEDQPIDRDQLALDAFNGVLPFLIRWLEYLDGYEMEGQWFPSNGMDKARCLELVHSLSDQQIEQLRWRGFTLPRAVYEESNPPFEDGHTALVPCKDPRVRAVIVIDKRCTDRVGRIQYELFDDDALLRLYVDDWTLLMNANYPGTIDGVLSIIWRRIAPADPVKQTPGA